MCLFECSLIELFFFAYEEDLILFSRKYLGQSNDPFLRVAQSHWLFILVFCELLRHIEEVLQPHLGLFLLLLDLFLLKE